MIGTDFVAKSAPDGYTLMLSASSEVSIWMPAKPPRDVLEKLQGEFVRIIQSADYKQRQLEAATDIVGSSAETLGNFQKTEIEKYRKIAAAAGIMPE